jgi:branched-chain amino acid transport system substrate-binding protein
MALTRRAFAAGVAAGTMSTPLLTAGAKADEPIRIGWLAALTGPSSSPGAGFDRGVHYAVDQINGSGGVKGRQIELITRDTQGDPTKAVNATQELISRQKVHAIWGPTNSGEALATVPIMARQRMPNLIPCVVESLIDPVKYPSVFRPVPTNSQWDDAVRLYCLSILKLRKVAVVGDTTGYGTSAVNASVAAFKKDGADVVYQAQIDATNPDVSPDMLRMKNAGAEAIVVWTVSAGLDARLLNGRAHLDWDIPVVGHPSMGSGEVSQLLDKRSNWDKVYIVGFKNCSFDAQGKLPPAPQAFVDSVKGKIALSDTSLWWITSSIDAIHLIADAIRTTGSSDSEAIVKYWNTVKHYPGLYGTYTFSPQEHNGYPTPEVVMSLANSQRDGAYSIAPGYT